MTNIVMLKDASPHLLKDASPSLITGCATPHLLLVRGSAATSQVLASILGSSRSRPLVPLLARGEGRAAWTYWTCERFKKIQNGGAIY